MILWVLRVDVDYNRAMPVDKQPTETRSQPMDRPDVHVSRTWNVQFLARLNRLRWFVRWPIKWAIFGIAYAAVCFPYPHLAIRHMRHWLNPNALIEPDAPALAPLAEELRAQVSLTEAPKKVLGQVEQFVYKHVPYEWDWNTWGMADYLPTVDEVLEMGREDCDGRAVVAASLLKNLGYDARLVTDFAHVWVWTPAGETMGPGKIKTVQVTDEGVRINARGLMQLPQILGYGIAVFPWQREVLLVVVAWLLLLGNAAPARALTSLVVVLVGLFMVRYGAMDYRGPRVILELAGAAMILLGAVFMSLRLSRRIGHEAYEVEALARASSSGNPV